MTGEPVVALNPVEGLQLYVVPPPAVRLDVPPAQKEEAEAVPVIAGLGLTVSATVDVFVHPPALVPVTVYVTEEVGLAVTLALVVELSPVEGLQLYVEAPPAVRVLDPPAQKVDEDALDVTTGLPLTVITCVCELLPEALLAVSDTV